MRKQYFDIIFSWWGLLLDIIKFSGVYKLESHKSWPRIVYTPHKKKCNWKQYRNNIFNKDTCLMPCFTDCTFIGKS